MDDENEPMLLGIRERDVIYLWMLITGLSTREKVKTQKNKKEFEERYLPTLEKMDLVFNTLDWQYLSITKDEALNYVLAFHLTYNQYLLG